MDRNINKGEKRESKIRILLAYYLSLSIAFAKLIELISIL